MSNELTKLYNTLLGVETKGESTKLMGVCLQFLENLITETKSKETAAETETNKEVEE